MNLKDKTIFVTGGTQGIGLAIVKKLSEQEANIVVYSLDIKRFSFFDFNENKILAIEGDVKDRTGIKKAMRKAIEKFGSLDILVNNAGVAKSKRFIETNEKDWNFIFDVNVKGVFTCIQEFIKAQNYAKKGSQKSKVKSQKLVINIASGAGIYGVPKIAVYSASKAAIINISQSLNGEFEDMGVRFIAVCPGSTETDMFRNLFPSEKALHTTEDVAEVVYKTIIGKIKPDNRMIVDVFHHMRSNHS